MEKELYVCEVEGRAVLLTNDKDMQLKDITSLLEGDIPELKRDRARLDSLRNSYSKPDRELEKRLLETDALFKVSKPDYTPNTDVGVVMPYADTKDDLSVPDFCSQKGLRFLGTLESRGDQFNVSVFLSRAQELGFFKGVKLKQFNLYQPGPDFGSFQTYMPSEINIPVKLGYSPEKEPDLKTDGQKHYFRRTGKEWVEVPKDKILGADAVPRHMRREGHGYNVVVDDRVEGKNTVHVYEDGNFVCSMDLAEKYKIRSSEKGYSDLLGSARRPSYGPRPSRWSDSSRKNIKYREKGR